jgi:micrococcal nuclease
MTPTGHAQTLYGVLRVIDGDTIELETVGKVRLIGVDTPETVHPSKPVEHFGKEASDFLRHLLEGGEVWLEYDWQRKDKYGRTLAYVYLPDSTFVNEAIIRFGYGHGYTNYPFKYLEEFRALEREAREAGRGLWAPQTGGTAVAPKAGATGAAEESEELTVYVTRTGSKYHREGCRYLARSMIPISLKEAVPKIRPVQRLRPADRRVHLQVLPVNLPTTHAKHIDSLSGDHEEGHSV